MILPSPSHLEKLVTVQEAAKILHVWPMTVWKWIWRGWMPAYRFGPKLIRLRACDVELLRITVIQQTSEFGNLTAQKPGSIVQTLFPREHL